MLDKDEELIDLYISGDDRALKELIERYTPQIYNFVRRFVGENEADDITQDVFIKVWKNLKKFNSKKSSFKTWIFTIARNTTIDFMRKKKIVLFSNLDNEENIFEETIKDEVALPDEILQKLQDVELLNSLLEKLPEQYKTVLALHYQEEMTFEEAGKVLGKPLNTVKSYHFRALKLLHQTMKNQRI
jgi:RNA polymerase sigma-70 factor (ECF subfamily)